jgi:hypothetical protein
MLTRTVEFPSLKAGDRSGGEDSGSGHFNGDRKTFFVQGSTFAKHQTSAGIIIDASSSVLLQPHHLKYVDSRSSSPFRTNSKKWNSSKT